MSEPSVSPTALVQALRRAVPPSPARRAVLRQPVALQDLVRRLRDAAAAPAPPAAPRAEGPR